MLTQKMKMAFPGGKKKALTLSYDDGNRRDRRLCELMRKYGAKGTFNLNSGYLSTEPEENESNIGWQQLTAAQCREVYGTDMEVAIHGRNHPWLEKLPTPEAMAEIIEDRIGLEELTGLPVRGGAYPYGTYNDAVVEILRLAGIAYCRTTKRTGGFALPTDWLRLHPTAHHSDPDLMELARHFVETPTKNDDPWLFYLWGHTYEFDRDDNWALIEEFLRMVGGREDIWYATNLEVYDYVHAYEELLFDIRRTVVKNPTCQDIYLSIRSENWVIKIPAGKTVRLAR